MYTPRCAVVPLRGARDLLTALRDASLLHLGANPSVCVFSRGPTDLRTAVKCTTWCQ